MAATREELNNDCKLARVGVIPADAGTVGSIPVMDIVFVSILC